MVWTILLVKQKDNGWFLNYIKSKLLEQINKLNLQNNIEIIISDNLPVIFGNYISIIDEIIDISDNFIESVYNVLKNSTKDYIGLKGKIIIDDNTFIFNNLDYTDNEIFIPITKLNPIKKEIVLNIQNYFSYDNLTSFVKNSDNIDNIVVFKENIKKESVSIIITAYKSQNFIEECLDSIINQSYFINNNNFEILVGVDGCAETYNKLSEIKHKYRNLNIYMMAENKGTYVTTNTLIDLTKFENILRFDSDDIMKPDLVKEVFKHKKDNDLLMLGSVDLKDGKIGNDFLITPGIIFFKKNVMNIAGGYRSWLCAADSELISRLKDKIKISKINVALFYRRIHKNSLTSKPETGYGSTLRKEYIKQMNSYKGNIKIIKEVNKIVNKIENKSNLKIAFGMIVFNGDYVLKECLESIYPYASQILIAEGPVSYWQKKGYTTSTDKTNEIIDNFPDPENKISIVHSQYREKDEQANAYMKFLKEDNDYIWNIDSDEIFKGEDIEKIMELLEREKYTTVGFRSYSFFGGFDKYISGYESSLPYIRIRKLYPGSYWSTHRPPTLKHIIANKPPEKILDFVTLSDKYGIYMYHYSHVFPDQVYEKTRYYGESLRPTKVIENYFSEVYLPWVLGDDRKKNEIELKFNGVDENIKKPSDTKFFPGQHPKVITENFDKLKNKFETQLKKYDSAEFRLSLIKNTTTTTTTVAPKTTTTTFVTTTNTLASTTIKTEEKIPISIIIAAYKAQDFIEECLDSIENQDYFINNDNFEVLIGVDGCNDTLNKILKIRNKYRNLRIFNMNNNKGAYITTNTLLDLIKYENIIIFGADDIMKHNMISEISKFVPQYDIIQFSFYDFYDSIKDSRFTSVVAVGAIFYTKNIIDMAGGYQPWICAADRELLKRVSIRVKIIELRIPLFYRRVHSNSLTIKEDTGMKSELRKGYKKLTRDYGIDENIKINKITNSYVEIIKQFSIVIPTMWLSNKLIKMLQVYQDSDYVKEVIIIDNNPTKKIKLEKFSKIRYFTKEKNIYVNPSWNLGYSLSNYNLILANDDILIGLNDFNKTINEISNSNYDIIGVDLVKDDFNIRIEEILDFPEKSYGCFMYIKNYTYIPEQFKIWYGDYFLFNNSKKRGILKNSKIITNKSETINSNRLEFRDKIGKSDIEEYYKFTKNTDNDLNIIIRTSNRPIAFSRCINSIRKNYPKAKLHITIDDIKDLDYVNMNVYDFDYTYYLINKETIKNICDKIDIERNQFIYNYYFNIVKPFLNGWCLIIDDDDELLITPKIEKNTNNIYLYRADVKNKIVPSEINFGKTPKLNDISTLCIIFHSSQMINWNPQRGGDYDFISELYKIYNPIWNNSIISKSMIGANFGNRTDIRFDDNLISVNIATYPLRKEVIIKCINNLLTIDIIDIIRIYLNEYTSIPEDFPIDNKIKYVIGQENIKDSGKFYWSSDIKNEYYFTLDDDLIYTKEFFINHILQLKKYNNDIFVTSHGREMKPFPNSFNDGLEINHCLKDVDNDVWINNGGTGVMVFDNSKFIIPLSMFEYHGMTDLWIAYYCQIKKIPILCRKHKSNELSYLLKNEETLWSQKEKLRENHKKIIDLIGEWKLYKI